MKLSLFKILGIGALIYAAMFALLVIFGEPHWLPI